jgi:hypothetical protein
MIPRSMVRPARRRALVGAVLLAAVTVTAPATAQPGPPDLQARLSEVASLYGDHGATVARIVDTSRVGVAGRVLGVALPGSRRHVVVFVLAGRTPAGPLVPLAGPSGGPQRNAVVSGAIDARTGSVVAVRRNERAPDLGALGPVHSVRLARRPGAPQVVGGVTFDTALTRLVAAGYQVAVPHFPAFAPSLPESPQLRRLVVSDALPVGRRTVTLQLRPIALPLASPTIPLQRPSAVTVPSLIGVPYQTVLGTLPSGLYLRVKRIGPLSAASSVRGLDALVVSAQEPAAGTQLPAYGVPIPNGVNLGPSVVTVTVAARGPGA